MILLQLKTLQKTDKMKRLPLLFALLWAFCLEAQTTTTTSTPTAGRFFDTGTPPPSMTAKPIGFNNADVWHDSIAGAWYKWNPATKSFYLSAKLFPINKDGKAAKISVVNTVTLPAGSSAAVVNTGTADSAALVFYIPQGPAGSSTGGSSTNNPAARYVNTFAELRQALQDANSYGTPSTVYIGSPFVITDSLPLPKRRMQFTIDGQGVPLTVKTASGTAFYSDAASVTESDAIIDFAPRFLNLWLIDPNKDTKGKGDAIRVTSTYGAVVNGCWFEGFARQIFMPRAMNYTVTKCRGWACSGINCLITWRNIPGGTPSTTQPNLGRVTDNVWRVDSLATAALWIEGGSGQLVTHNVIEGGTDSHHGSRFGMYLSTSGSPNVKSLTAEDNHFEVIFAEAACVFEISDGSAFFNRNYWQYGGTIVQLKNTWNGYPSVFITFPDWIPNDAQAGYTKFHANLGGAWTFSGTRYPFKESDPYWWVGGAGAMPTAAISTGFGEGSNLWPFVRTFGELLRFNSKFVQLTTSPDLAK